MTNFREVLEMSERAQKVKTILEEVKNKEARIDIVAALVEEYVDWFDIKSEQRLLDLIELFLCKYVSLSIQSGYRQAEKEAKKAALKSL